MSPHFFASPALVPKLGATHHQPFTWTSHHDQEQPKTKAVYLAAFACEGGRGLRAFRVRSTAVGNSSGVGFVARRYCGRQNEYERARIVAEMDANCCLHKSRVVGISLCSTALASRCCFKIFVSFRLCSSSVVAQRQDRCTKWGCSLHTSARG